MIKLNIKVKTRRRLTYSDVEFFFFCDSFKIVSSNSNIKSISLNATFFRRQKQTCAWQDPRKEKKIKIKESLMSIMDEKID